MDRTWLAVFAACLWWTAVVSFVSSGPATEASRWRHVQHIEDVERVVVDVDLISKPNRVVVAELGGRVSFWRDFSPDDPWGLPSGPELPVAELPAYGAGTIRAIAASRAGKRVAVATEHAVTVWNTRAGEALGQFRIRDGGPETVAINAGGTLLATRTGPHAVTVWHVTTRKEALTLRGSVSEVTTVALDSGGVVAVGGAKGEAEVWNVWRKEILFRATVHPGAITRVDLSPDSELLATGAADGDVKLWDVAAGELVAEFNTGQGGVTGLSIGKWSRRVVTVCESGAVQRWDIATAAEVRRDAPAGSGARTVVLAHGGLSYAVVGDGYSLRHARTGEQRRAPGGKRFVTGVQLSQIGGRVLAAYENGDAEVFEVATGKAVYAHVLARRPWELNFYHTGPRDRSPYMRTSPVRLFPNGRQILLAGRVGSPPVFRNLWDEGPPSLVELEGGRETVAFPQDPPSAAPCVLGPDHSLLVTGSRDGGLHLWDVATRTYLRSFEGKYGGRDGGYRDASMDRANRWLAAVGWKAGASVWNVRTGERRDLPAAWSAGGSSVRLSPDGRYLLLWVAATSTDTGSSPVRLWDLMADEEATAPAVLNVVGASWSANPTELRLLTERPGSLSVVAWSPGERGVREVITVPTPELGASSAFAAPYARPDGPRRLAVSYDGSTMAFTTDDGAIEVWRKPPGAGTTPREHEEP